MGHAEDFDLTLPLLLAIPAGDVRAPDMPADVAAQEGEDLFAWAQPDKEQLMAAGLDWSLVESLRSAAAALREAESRWLVERYARDEAREDWKNKAPGAYALRAEMLHDGRYAYRNHGAATGKLRQIARGTGHADMIQDLSDLASLGHRHADLLKAINYDLGKLDSAKQAAHELAGLLAESRATDEYIEAKDVRDRAFTYLQGMVRAIRDCGQYVFWRDGSRVSGYASAYCRATHAAATAEETPAVTTSVL